MVKKKIIVLFIWLTESFSRVPCVPGLDCLVSIK